MKVRTAYLTDWPAIEALSQRALRTLPRIWRWEEYLAHNLFVVIEHQGVVVGALFAWPDESPVAWVRMAALDNALDVGDWLGVALPAMLDRLREQGVQKLAWMDSRGWVSPYLGAHGFRRLAEVITLVKSNRAMPGAHAPAIRLRQASDADVPAVVAVDRAAFTPHWWHSETTVSQRAAASPYFAVAELAGEVVGYAEGDLHLPVAHINRIAVHPAHQSHGIGALLLAFWQQAAEQVTLNTQADNQYSLRLYRRFGFEPTGDVITAWELDV
jgi:ribosomal-protein-alanine N-acetyltransferase